MKSAKLDSTGLRWVAELSLYHFSIKYKPGKSNTAADALSRLDETEVLSAESVKALYSSSAVCDFISSVAMSSQVIPDCSATSNGQTKLDTTDWAKLQSADEAIGPVLAALENSTKLVSKNPESWKIWSQKKRLIIEDEVLFRTCQSSSGVVKQLVLPAEKRTEVLRLLHDEMGHFGRDRVINLIHSRFYWPGVQKSVTSYIESCENCLKRKGQDPVAELSHLTSSQPMELVCMDYLGLENSGQYQNILVLTDHFSRFAMAIPTTNQTAKTTAKALINLFINHYGLPVQLHSDQGANFTGKVISEMCRMLGVKRSTTSAYHPMANGQTERFNRTLLDMLGTLPEDKKSRWKDYVQPLVHVYNCTKSEVTGYSPFQLMFGRNPRLPIDQQFGLMNDEEEVSYNEYVEDLRSKLEESYEIAKKKMGYQQGKSKERYDRKIRGNQLEIGDRVLVRKTKFEEGKHKLANKWEDKVYIVVRKLNGIPVFELKPEDGKGRNRRLHRNNILPISIKGDRQRKNSSSSDSSFEEINQVIEQENDQRSERSELNESVVSEKSAEEPAEESPSDESNHEEEQEEEVNVAPTLPRRSVRERRPPERFRSGDYVMNFQQTRQLEDPKYAILTKVLDLLK